MTVGAITSQSLALQVDQCSQYVNSFSSTESDGTSLLRLQPRLSNRFPLQPAVPNNQLNHRFLLPHCLQKYVQILFQPALVKGFSCRMKFLKLTVGEPRPRPVLIVNIVMVIQTKEDKLGATSQIK